MIIVFLYIHFFSLPHSNFSTPAWWDPLRRLAGNERRRRDGLSARVRVASVPTGRVVAVHVVGLHAADLIQECANAVTTGTTVQELRMMVHTDPTLSEVMDEAFKGAVGMSSH
jgi:hypothetical protein